MINENARQGTTQWIPTGPPATSALQAYVSATSVMPGQLLSVYASVAAAGRPLNMSVYRLGWYNGRGARLMLTGEQAGMNQGHYDPSRRVLVGCDQCAIDPATHLVEARWSPTFAFTIPADWYTGVYYIVLSDDQADWTYVSFVVRGAPSSTYVAVLPDTTWQAYNNWGGYSLYIGPDGAESDRATKISFDRPLSGLPLGRSLAYEIDAVRWFERMGYDISYMTSVDLHEHPEQLLAHKAMLSLGHDEYWSSQMRDGVEQARDAGVGLAFMGANAAFWQIRFEPDGLGQADHTIVCYKNPSLDPLFGRDSARVTDMWRDLGRPENALIGIMYSSYSNGDGYPWHLDTAAASSSLVRATGLVPGSTYGCDFVGYEWDRVHDNGATPAGLRILATSATIAPGGVADSSNTTYYVASSGALVFATGSIYWSYALDDFRLQRTGNCRSQSAHNTGMQLLMANVMEALVVHHPRDWQ